jgi:hypothetical protein
LLGGLAIQVPKATIRIGTRFPPGLDDVPSLDIGIGREFSGH